jgi:hypothetical protein
LQDYTTQLRQQFLLLTFLSLLVVVVDRHIALAVAAQVVSLAFLLKF